MFMLLHRYSSSAKQFQHQLILNPVISCSNTNIAYLVAYSLTKVCSITNPTLAPNPSIVKNDLYNGHS
ncbi:hypothetical protein JTE90_011309 [Oedothorax gibbosus]|uniref:Uncharacterized protein n=1 Tax=Oedothorax gibbosus TaxID=931172 RepID=A0AAV6VN57_9ARAC|nr:hypothetical protein JTE90_011309 [Oedothorax gibbosus]